MKTYYEFFRKLILPLDKIDSALPNTGVILDLGCGQGLIAEYLAQQGNRRVIGIDSNIKRLPESSFPNLTYKKGDITKITFGQINGVVISDVLHHLQAKHQLLLLSKIHRNLKNGGVLVIKEIDTGEFIRSKLSKLWDFLLYPKDKIAFTNCKYMTKALKNLRFRVQVSRPCRLFPGSTTLYICIKY